VLRDSAEAQRRKTACVTLTEFDQASELFERALKVDPDSLAARVNLGALKPTDRRFWVYLNSGPDGVRRSGSSNQPPLS